MNIIPGSSAYVCRADTGNTILCRGQSCTLWDTHPLFSGLPRLLFAGALIHVSCLPSSLGNMKCWMWNQFPFFFFCLVYLDNYAFLILNLFFLNMLSRIWGDSVKAWEREQWGVPICVEERKRSAKHFWWPWGYLEHWSQCPGWS